VTRKTRKTGEEKLQASLLFYRSSAVVGGSYQPTGDPIFDVFGDGAAWRTYDLDGTYSTVSLDRETGDDLSS
jgi:hypothetical protein